jgi:hypothetical protein
MADENHSVLVRIDLTLANPLSVWKAKWVSKRSESDFLTLLKPSINDCNNVRDDRASVLA